MPRRSKMETWIESKGITLTAGMTIRMPDSDRRLQVVTVDDGGALVREGEGRSRSFIDGRSGKEVNLQGKGKMYRISANSEVMILKPKGDKRS